MKKMIDLVTFNGCAVHLAAWPPLLALPTLHQVKEHHRKLRREARKNPNKSRAVGRSITDLPNLNPMKAKLVNKVCAAIDTPSCLPLATRHLPTHMTPPAHR